MNLTTEQKKGAPTVEVVTRMCHKSMERHTISSQKRFQSAAEKWIIPVLGPIPIDRLTSEDLRYLTKNYLDSSSPSNKPHTLGGYRTLLIYLQAILYFAIRSGLIKEMPFKIILPNEHRAIPILVLSEFGPFLEAVDSITQSGMIRLAVRMMLILGLRLREVREMRWSMVSMDCGVIRIIMPTGGTVRYISIPGSLRDLLLDYKETWRQNWIEIGDPMPQWVFADANGNPYLPVATQKVISRAAHAIKLHGLFTTHSLRLSCIEAGLAQFHSSRDLAAITRYLHRSHGIEYTLPYLVDAGLMQTSFQMAPSECAIKAPEVEP